MSLVYRIQDSKLKECGMNYRITFLTERLVRLEYQKDGHFVDYTTACVQNRDFGPVEVEVSRKGNFLEYNTPYLQVLYDEQPFSSHGLSIKVKTDASLYTSVWYYGQPLKTLGGTARTLDFTDGEVEIGDGIVSQNGFSVLDDSRSALFIDGQIQARPYEGQDLYFFGYAHDYEGAMRDFYHLSGQVPMLPRYALGNWWSRYYEYSQEEYLSLMDKFESKNVPLSVAVIDMDWHITKVDPKYGSGWTGYTWNKELFPDPKAFMEDLHRRGMVITLNLHPANGVQPYEEAYEPMRRALGVPEGQPIDFNSNDPAFMDAYFKYLHHPLEEMGVDFWWIDWQQGTVSGIKGIDPLFVLNHAHFSDSARKGDRALILSRYFGPGSHRYPVGFSGDTHISWKSLALQPAFTARSANVGYGYWSHDIGGHYAGTYDEELFVRWVQFGVFSPILRLHSSKNDFSSKEPWVCGLQNELIISDYLRLRHQLLPYLYTAMMRNSQHGEAICTPLYYKYPEYLEAYKMENEYYFGTELLVAPVVSPMIEKLNAAKVKVWIPNGLWFDFFTGKRYAGNGYADLYRRIEESPVLAKAGAIVPMTESLQANELPDNLVVRIFPGASNVYSMYEDDGKMEVESVLRTHFRLDWEAGRFSIELEGEYKLIPANRSYLLEFVGFADLACSGQYIVREGNVQRLALNAPASLQFEGFALVEENHLQLLFDRLAKANIDYMLKEELYNALRLKEREVAIQCISALVEDADLLKYILEVL